MADIKSHAGKVLASVAATAALTLGLFSAAHAVEPDSGTGPWDAPADATGTLRIHKHLGESTGQANDGTAIDVDRPKLVGIPFEICPVPGVDLRDGAGWTQVLEWNTELDQTGVFPGTTGECALETTNDDGLIEVQKDMGLYLVREVVQQGSDLAGSKPFLVTLPYPSDDSTPENPNWLWTVDVYPKNYMDNHPFKEIIDPEDIQWTVGAKIPWVFTSSQMGVLQSVEGRGGKIVNFHMRDQLDSYTTDVPGTVQITPVKDKTCEGATALCYKGVDKVSFVEGTDYFVHYTPAGAPGGELVVQMSAAGVKKMNDDLGISVRLAVSFKTQVVKAPGTHEIINIADEYTNVGSQTRAGSPDSVAAPTTKPATPPESPEITGPVGPGNPGEHTNEVHNFWASVVIDKVDKDEPSKGIDGARFQVLSGACKDHRSKTWNEIQSDGAWVKDEDLSPAEWVSANGGKVNIDALYVGRANSYEDSQYCVEGDGCKYNSFDEAFDRLQRAYCVVEMKAGPGYLLPKWPHNTYDLTVEAGEGRGGLNYLTITNQQASGPTLPVTGPAWTIAMIIGGAALLGAGFWFVRASRRRESESAQA